MSKLKRKKAAVDETKASPFIPKRRDVNEAARGGPRSSWWMKDDLPEQQRLCFIGLQEFCPNVFGDHSNLCVPKLPHPVDSSSLPVVHSHPPGCNSYPSTIVLPHPDLQSHRSSIRIGAGSSWWMRDDLPEEQRLCFIGLQEFCPNVFEDHSNLCVPNLPESPVKVTQWCWCGCRSMYEDGSAHPVASSPLPVVHSHLSECSGQPSAIVLPHPDPHSLCSSSPLHRNQQPPQSSVSEDWNTAAKRTPGPAARSDRGKAVEPAKTSRGTSDLSGSTAAEPASGSGVKMDCCPMCLTVFPTGFSQMQCDEHLAQCLSELHADLTW